MAYDFQKEEDVKEYLKNLGLEYRFQCYHEHDPDGCGRLGEFLETVKSDFRKASKIFKTNCDDNNHGRSCYRFAHYSYLGRACTKDVDQALHYYKKGCENNSPEACFHAGLLLSASDQKYKDFGQGVKYFEKGCNLKNPDSCYFASSMYISGMKDVEQDMKKAFHYTFKACEFQNIYACANLSQMYSRGEGVEKNDAKAVKYKTRALDLREQQISDRQSVEFGRIA